MACPFGDLKHRHVRLIADAGEEIAAARPEIAALRPLVRQRQLAGNGNERVIVLVRARQRHRAKEALRIGVAHGAEHVPDPSCLDRLARIHDGDGIAALEDEPEIVRDEERGGSGSRGQILDQRDDARLDRHVERRRRLVEDQEPRVGEERHRDDDALLLAARELMGIGAHDAVRVGQAHGLDDVERALVRFLLPNPVMDQRHFHQLLTDQHGRIEGSHRLLIDHGDLRPSYRPEFWVRERGHVPPLEPDRAAGDPPDARQVAHHRQRHRRFAATRFAHEAHRLSGHHLAGEVHDCRDFTGSGEERDAQAVDFEDGFSHSHCSQSRSDCSRIASASRFRPSTKDMIASAGGRAG